MKKVVGLRIYKHTIVIFVRVTKQKNHNQKLFLFPIQYLLKNKIKMAVESIRG